MDSDDDMGDEPCYGSQNNDEGVAPSSGKATLKRGDACLACRRRRIRCNAAKPACATCVRLKKQCVYETGKSTSRIAQLKARIAELEAELDSRSPASNEATGAGTSSQSNLSTSNPGTSPSIPHGNGSHGSNESRPLTADAQQAHSHSTIDPTALGFAIPSTQGTILPISPALPAHLSTGVPHLSVTTPIPQTLPLPSHPDSQTLSNGFIPPHDNRAGNTAYPQSIGPRLPREPDPHFDFDLSFLDETVHDLSASMYSASMQMNDPGGMNTMHASATGFAVSPLDDSPSYESEATSEVRAHLESVTRLVGIRKNPDVRVVVEDDDEDHTFGMPQLSEIEILPGLPQGRELVGGWFDPNDVPHAVRDHLLDLFLSRQNKGSLFHVVFHIPRLYTRLTLGPSKRPHPCLMYAIYTTAARLSSQPAIKQLEGQFYSIAEKQIRMAIKNHDRLLDAVRAMALLVSYLFSKEQYSLGYHMTGTAIRLAISCGLDRIPTSVWGPPPPFNAAVHCTLRTGGYAIPPPEDSIDLAERIYAFWAVYEVDLCTAIAYLWHTGLPIEDIRTPLPRPMIEYELGIVSEKDDVTIGSVLDSEPPRYPADNSFLVLRMKAITFLARVLKLRQDKPEVPTPNPSSPSAAGSHTCSYPGSVYGAWVTHPQGFNRLKTALDHYVDTLPAEHRPPWRWDEGDQLVLPRVRLARDTSVIHFLTGNAYMQLWNVRALDSPNERAILIARRLVNVMYLFQTEPMSSGYDIFMITIWNEVAMVLVREAKRAQLAGEQERAAEIDADLGVAIASLKKWGDVDVANGDDGADIAAINGKMLEQLRAMPVQEWAEAVAESQRRWGGGAELGVFPSMAPSGTPRRRAV